MPTTKDRVFERVMVDHAYRGQTRVTWRIRDDVCPPGPWTLSLQRGDTGNPLADDWETVAGPLADVSELIDPRHDLRGTNPVWHYRVVLQAGGQTYVSQPAHIFGIASKGKWLQMREILRLEKLRFDKAEVMHGWLLKRKRRGVVPHKRDPARMVTDPITGEIINSRRPETVGTEFVGGFYAPIPYQVDMSLGAHYEERDNMQGRGTIDDPRLQRSGRVIMFPPVAHNDVFVHADSDLRYVAHKVTHLAEINGIPLLANIEWRQAEFGDILYTVPMPDDLVPSSESSQGYYCGD